MTVFLRDPIILPSFNTGFANSGDEALFTSLWDEVTFAIFPDMGPAPKLYDFSGRRSLATAAPAAMDASWIRVDGTWRYEHTSTGDVTALGPIDNIVPLRNVTILIGYEKSDGTPRASGAFGNTSVTVTHRCGVHLPFSDGEVYFDFAGIINGTTRVNTNTHGAGNPVIGDDNWAFTTGHRGMEIWQNGIRIALAPLANPTRLAAANTLNFGTHATAASDLAYYKYFIVYGRQLTPEEIDVVNRYPKAMLMMASWKGARTFEIHTKSVPDPITFVSELNVIRKDVSHSLEIRAGILEFLAIDDFKPLADIIGFGEVIDYSESILKTSNRFVEDDLGISDSVEWSGFANVYPANILSIRDNVDFCFGAPWSAIEVFDTLGLTQRLGFGIPRTVTDTIVFTDVGFKNDAITQELNFLQAVTIGIGYVVSDTIVFAQTLDTDNEYTRSISDTNIIEDAAAYYVLNACTPKQYNRFEGSGSATGIPEEPLTFDASFTLETLTGTKELLQLRNPESDDRHRIGYTRINRETRGGELNVFADPTWPQVHTLLFTLVALSDGKYGCPEKINTLITFFQTNLGKEILLHDWEGLSWRGVITTPNEVATEDRDGWWTMTFEFEGVQLDGSQGDQQLSISDAVHLNADWVRTILDDVGITDSIGVAGILNESISHTMYLTDSLSGSTHDSVTLSDTFSGGGGTDLDGQSPVVGTSTWSAHTNYKADGTQTAINSGAYYPFAPVSGTSYDIIWGPRALAESDGLETTFFLGEGLNSDPDDTGIVAFGRTDPTTLKAGFVLRKIGVTQLNACRLGDTIDGIADTVDFTDGPLKALSDNIDLKLVLDTYGGAGNWTVEWFAKSTISSTWTQVRAPQGLLSEDITMLGWANNNITTTVDMDLISITERVSL